jgi:hypothetical protein
MKKQEVTAKPEPPETILLALKAPIDFFERLDRWCEQIAERERMTMKPSRPMAIRWIVYQFLEGKLVFAGDPKQSEFSFQKPRRRKSK